MRPRLRFIGSPRVLNAPSDDQLIAVLVDLPRVAGSSRTSRAVLGMIITTRRCGYVRKATISSRSGQALPVSTINPARRRDRIAAAWLAWKYGSSEWRDPLEWTNYPAATNTFAARPYDLTVFLVGDGAEPLWDTTTWLKAVPMLTPVVTSSGGRVSVESLQGDLSADDRKRSGPDILFAVDAEVAAAG